MIDHFVDLTQMVPERIVLSADAFTALQRRLDVPGRYDQRVAKVLSTPAPWDEGCDKTSTSADQWLTTSTLGTSGGTTTAWVG